MLDSVDLKLDSGSLIGALVSHRPALPHGVPVLLLPLSCGTSQRVGLCSLFLTLCQHSHISAVLSVVSTNIQIPPLMHLDLSGFCCQCPSEETNLGRAFFL